MVSMLISLALLASPGTITCKGDFKLTYVGLLPTPKFEYSKIENINSSHPEMTQVEFKQSKSGRDEMKAKFSETAFEFGGKNARLRKITVSLSTDTLQNLFAADMQLTGSFKLKCTLQEKSVCMIEELYFGQPKMPRIRYLEYKLIGAEISQMKEKVEALQKNRGLSNEQQAKELKKIMERLKFLTKRKIMIEKGMK